ncbi:site-specific DNA-methyltransferase [Marinobacter gelidimuriae]|uniref:site-specific DNA-methyltransferase n=1 Tax=Marinobacter gelidimuriae TaxID=2739064 RepID=UPI0015A6F390|nr:site-specific DNA-methyltransferase [Marinobacter gelidimuriae]
MFTETRDNNGELVETLDYERLKAELGNFSEIYDNRRERYGMDWPGKRDCLRLIQEPSRATLKPCREESVDFDTTENLFIEGDNLEALKLLQKSYYGKVKMIYIDPPYNTGKEFIYPDNFSESLDTYLQYAGLKDNEGRTFSTNTANEGRFHTKWLNMMYPRLYLARNLLREDGVIFISIDDNEVENLRRMCDEIFGEENFIAQFIWEKRTNRENRKIVSTRHDYIVCYSRNTWESDKPISQLPMNDKALASYKNPDNDPRGSWKSDPATAQAGHGTKSQFYDLGGPNGKVHKLESGRCWLYTEKVMAQAIEENRIWFGKNGNGVPRVKTYLEAKERGLTPETIFFAEDVGTTEAAKNKIKELFGGIAAFETPKPVQLLQTLLKLSSNPGIVLDFFAGSGSLAEAVYEENITASRTRFVLVQLPEPCDEGSEAEKIGMATIADIAKERIRRAGNRIREKVTEQLDLNGLTGNDLGFKVLKLNQSNFKLWQAPSKDISDDELLQQMDLNVDHIDPNASQEDLLYELLIKAGVMPTEKVERIELSGHTVFSVAEGTLLMHLEDDIDQALIDVVLVKAPSQFICLDKAFHGNDQLKTNAVKTFEAFSQGKEKIDQIDFKTV